MARTKFEVGKVYVTMNDTFCEGDGKGKSAVIKRTDTVVYFKNLSSGEEFEREVTIYDGADVEGCDAFDVTDNFVADNFGVEIEVCEEFKACDEVKVPAKREVKAIIATIAEKHGFETDLNFYDLGVVKMPENINGDISLTKEKIETASTETRLFKIYPVYKFYTLQATTSAGLSAQAEFMNRLAQFAKDIEDAELIYSRSSVERTKSSGVILESGDENLIKKYVEVLNVELDDKKDDVKHYQIELEHCDSELEEFEGKKQTQKVKAMREIVNNSKKMNIGVLQRLQGDIAYLEGELQQAEKTLQKLKWDKVQAKIAEQKNKPHKSIIDWDALDDDETIATGKNKKAA